MDRGLSIPNVKPPLYDVSHPPDKSLRVDLTDMVISPSVNPMTMKTQLIHDEE